MPASDYRVWRAKAHSSLVYKKEEQCFLKDWIADRRREIEAGKLGIYKHNTAEDLLQKTLCELKKLGRDEPTRITALMHAIEMFLKHEA
jgi:hypothetical protein